MTSQGNGYIMCEVHHGIGSSQEFPKEHCERNPEDKVKKVLGVCYPIGVWREVQLYIFSQNNIA